MVLFFRQNTAYEMRIIDWSSDVCSPDLSLLVISAKASAILSRFCGRGTIEPPSDRDEDGDEAWHQNDRKGHLDEHLPSHQPADSPRAESDRDEKKRIHNLTEDARHAGAKPEK